MWLKLRSSKSGTDRRLRATWAKTAAPTWIAAQLRYGSCSSLNERSLNHSITLHLAPFESMLGKNKTTHRMSFIKNMTFLQGFWTIHCFSFMSTFQYWSDVIFLNFAIALHWIDNSFWKENNLVIYFVCCGQFVYITNTQNVMSHLTTFWLSRKILEPLLGGIEFETSFRKKKYLTQLSRLTEHISSRKEISF